MWIYHRLIRFRLCGLTGKLLLKGAFAMLVYVLNTNGQPLMPTGRSRRVRLLLKNGQAKIVKSRPFTIKLLYESPGITQSIEYKQDTGYSHIGSSACSDKAELYSAEITLNNGIKNSLQQRREYRRTRRNRLRYRKPRFNNRRRSDGWLAPSIQHKVDTHVKEICKVVSILPITKICIEVANFDTQKLKNPDISGKEYQEGELCDYRNLREYVFFRDNYTCQVCGRNAFIDGAILHMHHVEYWNDRNRTNTPANGLTVCNKCHTPENHAPGGKLYGLKAKYKPLKAETFMATVRWRIVNIAREIFPDIEIIPTYGYLTKDKRITLNIEKSHVNDAYCIGDKQPSERLSETIYYTEKSKNNRSLAKFYDAKYIDSRDGKKKSGKELFNGRTTRNKVLSSENLHQYRQEKVCKGRVSVRKQHYAFQPHDIISWRNRHWTVNGVHNKGTRVLVYDEHIKKSVSVKYVRLISHAKTIY